MSSLLTVKMVLPEYPPVLGLCMCSVLISSQLSSQLSTHHMLGCGLSPQASTEYYAPTHRGLYIIPFSGHTVQLTVPFS